MSSFQQSVFASSRTVAPMCLRACHSASRAPCASCIVAMRPTSMTSNGSCNRFAPRSLAVFAASSTLSTVTYDSQFGGMFLFSYSAPTSLPSFCSITYGGTSGGPIGIGFAVQPNSAQ